MSATPALIVRHEPARLDDAIAEVRSVMERIGEPGAMVVQTTIAGTLKVIPEGNAHEAQEAITHLAATEPALFASTAQWTVVDAWVPTDLNEIRKAVAAFQTEMGTGRPCRVAVRPEATPLRGQRVMDAVSSLVPQLDTDSLHPDRELRIDILGDQTAIGLLDRNEFFSGPDAQ